MKPGADRHDQGNLWPTRGQYPKDLYRGKPPSVDVDTSREAMTREEATRKAAIVLDLIKALPLGLTSDQAEVILDWPHQTVSARFRELELKGHIRKTETKRTTRSGRRARVYVWEGP